jgi:16S rRNA (guanine527-N7)-methyltransferase
VLHRGAAVRALCCRKASTRAGRWLEQALNAEARGRGVRGDLAAQARAGTPARWISAPRTPILRVPRIVATAMAERDPLRQRLGAGLAALQLDLPTGVTERLLDYVDLLVRWNAAYNLSAVRDPAEMVTRHLLDSLAIAPHVRGATLADLGSGAGLPGLPLAIAAPQREVTLVDSNGKKARFLRAAVRELGLANVSVRECRVEAAEGRFDCITARAFASLADMLGRGGRLLAPGGTWLAQKGRFPHDELAALPDGFRVEAVLALAVPDLDAERHVVVIKRAGN